MPELTDAQKRAAARKAKILARGNAGLARLAQTARGDDAAKLYGEEGGSGPSSAQASPGTSRPQTPVGDAGVPAAVASGSTSSPSTSTAGTSASTSTQAPSTSAARGVDSAPQSASTTTSFGRSSTSSTSRPGWAPPAGARTGAGPGPGAPSEAEMRAQMDAMMAMLGGGGGGAGGAPDMANLFASLMGAPPGAAGPGAGPGLLGSGDDTPLTGPNPFAMGGMDPNNPFMDPNNPNPFAGMDPNANPFAGLDLGALGGLGGLGGPPAPKSRAQRLFPVVHLVAMIALVLFVTVWWEPALHVVRAGGEHVGSWAQRWSLLGGRSAIGAKTAVEALPVFYAFTTLEAILLATRMTLVRGPPALHPLLANVLPMMPPTLQRLVTTGSKYLGALTQTYTDACVFVFGIGCAVVVAEYLA